MTLCPECFGVIVSETKTQLNTFASTNLQEKSTTSGLKKSINLMRLKILNFNH